MQQEQMEEKEVEAQIQGVSVNGIKVEQAECDLDDRVYWVVYFHVHLLHVINLMAGI